jgi:hypothetical protein
MEIKTFEVRDRATFIPVIAIKPGARGEAERYLWSRAGYGATEEIQSSYVLLSRITGNPSNDLSYDPMVWNNRTMSVAHRFIKENWNSLINGQVIDVEFILGESKEPKKSERES